MKTFSIKPFAALAWATLAILAAIIFLIVTRARALAIADTDRELSVRAQMVSDSIDRILQTRMQETFTLAALSSLRGFAASDEAERPARIATAQSELRSIVVSDAAIRAASVVDADGRVILATDSSIDANWSERIFVQEGMAGHLYASAPARDFGEVSQYYSAPIFDNFGSVAAVLVLRLTAQEIEEPVRAVGNAFVVDENGVRIAESTASPRIFSAIAPLSNDAIARVLLNKQYGAEIEQIRVVPLFVLANQINSNRTSASYIDENGKATRAAIQRLEANPWNVVVTAHEDAALSPATLTFLESFGSGAAAAIVIGILAYFTLR